MSKPRIDFVTPVPLITCLARLPKEYIHLTGKGDYNFETPIQISKGHFNAFQARIHLESQDTETHITGGIYITQPMYVIVIFFVVLAFIAIQIAHIPFLCFPIALAFIILHVLLLLYQRHLVEERMLDAFRHFKYKTQTFSWWQRLVFPAIKLQREVPLSLYDLTNKLYRLHYEIDYVQMRERKERYFVINHKTARIFGWMRVIDDEHTAIQYWIGFDLVIIVASVFIFALFDFFNFYFIWKLSFSDIRDLMLVHGSVVGTFFTLIMLIECFRLWRKFRTTLNTVELKNWSLLQDLH